MTLGKKIRALRLKKGLSQEQLGKAVGVSEPMICMIERGTKNPSLQIGAEIAAVLGITIDELLEDDNNPLF